jgi:hypothetical protein
VLHKVLVHKILGTYTVEGETPTTRRNEDITPARNIPKLKHVKSARNIPKLKHVKFSQKYKDKQFFVDTL